MTRRLSFLLLGSLTALITSAPDAWGQDPPALRIPGAVSPVRYEAKLRLIPAEEEFRGSIRIAVRADEIAPTIWLHATKEMTIESATIQSAAGGKRPARVIRPADTDWLGLVPAGGALGKGATAEIEIAYRSLLDTKNSSGVFRGMDGGTAYLYTQFEPIDARRAFPCFDEPRYKVPWQLTLEVKKEHEAFANTAPVREIATEGGAMKRIEFAPTKPLPSYLLAFAVGPFEIVPAGPAGRTKAPVRIIVPKGRKAEAAYAVEVTPKILAALEEYFDIPYPYGKLDQIAVPLFGGAMENPGLVTYADTLLLGRREADTIERKRSYYEVCAHELAHQWFGDLVTMPWWNDLWLNESFATWMAAKITQQAHPEWNVDVQSVTETLQIMGQDGLSSARRIRQPVESNNDIANAFDGITYLKGGAVVQMIETWIGEADFRAGVRSYMRKHAYGSARAEDFFGALSAVAKGKDVTATASTFLDQGGVPEVSLSLRCERGRKPVATLTQRRFLPLGSKAKADQTWRIPVCLQWAGGGRQCTMLAGSEPQEMELAATGCPEWILGNENMSGYYRTRYGGEWFGKLMAAGYDKLPLRVRTGLLGEATAMASAGLLPLTDGLALVAKAKDAREREVVRGGVGLLRTFQSLTPPELRPNLARLVRGAFGARARELGWVHRPGDSDDTKLLRAALVPYAALRGDDGELLDKARELALASLGDWKSLPEDMRDAVLSAAAARRGDGVLFDRYLEAARAAKDARDRRTMLSAMASVEEPGLVARAQQLFLTGGFDAREAVSLLFAGMDSAGQRRAAFDFTKANLEEVEKRIPADITGAKGAMAIFTASRFCSASERAEAEAVFGERAKTYGGGPRTMAQVLESIDLCAARKAAQERQVAEILSRY
ncbi:MAG: M1 family metallopeptidase [Acidobacteria bacterium]|nr:M1 family metallopeptidase [Bryobacteraceae bacterium CoA2 C42]